MPRFSVVIPAFNVAETIASAVGSALGQTASDLEVIVVDDGSTDSTVEVVHAIGDPRVRLVSGKGNRGPSAARNAGIANSEGEYVAFLDGDDLWFPDYLALTGRALEETVRPGFAYTDAYVYEPSSGRVSRRSAMAPVRPPVPPPAGRDAFLFELLKRNFVYNSTTVPRAVLDDVSGWDESLRSSEDYQLWLRILMAGYTPIWVPGRHALYRYHEKQASSDFRAMGRSISSVYSGLSSEAMPTDAHRALLARRCEDSKREVEMSGRQSPVARLKQAIRRAQRRLGLANPWYDVPPPDVAAAFPDLRAVWPTGARSVRGLD